MFTQTTKLMRSSIFYDLYRLLNLNVQSYPSCETFQCQISEARNGGSLNHQNLVLFQLMGYEDVKKNTSPQLYIDFKKSEYFPILK